MNSPFRVLALSIFVLFAPRLRGADAEVGKPTYSNLNSNANQWRAEHRIIDMHFHVESTAQPTTATQRFTHAVKIMDAVGLGIAVNLSGGYTTRPTNTVPSEFERNKQFADQLFPGRFLHYMNLDYKGWDKPDFSERAVKQVEEGHRLGAAGFKEYKRLGLTLRDGEGKVIKIDDPKLDPVWKRCGELNMPISIHVADPRAFWLPFDSSNERWKELKDHRSWWFGDTNIYPPRMELLEALMRVVARHPKTTFVSVHFANNAEDIDWVDKMLDRYPNLYADLAARIPEIGRHDPQKVHRLFEKHQDRIIFATDFMVYSRLILGSSGNEPPPTDEDAEVFYQKNWRWLETWDKDWPHMTPIQGDWTISSIGLSAPILRKIYFDNARKILAHSLPPPVLKAARIENDFTPDGALSESVWKKAEPVQVEYQSPTSVALPEISTTVRALWSDKFLYLAYECPYTKLTVFDPPQRDKERLGLWDRDVVEAFIGDDEKNIKRYTEYEVAPTNERLDLKLNLPDHDFAWESGFESAIKIDETAHVWTAEWRIPLSKLSNKRPSTDTRWRINLYRCDRAHNAFLAWNPTLKGSFHAPERFGTLAFEKSP